jgi:ABC-type bacteriocin/lantibiotic exporter with double-glycine peptidase domain
MILFSISCSLLTAVGSYFLRSSRIHDLLARRAVKQGIRMLFILGLLVAMLRFGWLSGLLVMAVMIAISLALVYTLMPRVLQYCHDHHSHPSLK